MKNTHPEWEEKSHVSFCLWKFYLKCELSWKFLNLLLCVYDGASERETEMVHNLRWRHWIIPHSDVIEDAAEAV